MHGRQPATAPDRRGHQQRAWPGSREIDQRGQASAGADPHRSAGRRAGRSPRSRRLSLDALHSSRRRRVTSMRHSGAHDRVQAEVGLVGQAGQREGRLREVRRQRSAGPRPGAAAEHLPWACATAPAAQAISAGNQHDAETARVQNQGGGSSVQPAGTAASAPTGTRLRRRLSKIFQRDSALIGFLRAPPRPPAPSGSSQRSNLPVAADPAVPAADVGAVAAPDSPRTAARRSAVRSARSSPPAGRG